MRRCFILTMRHEYTLWFQLTGKSQHIIFVLGTSIILGILQNIICQFLWSTVLPKYSPSKILYHTVLHFFVYLTCNVPVIHKIEEPLECKFWHTLPTYFYYHFNKFKKFKIGSYILWVSTPPKLNIYAIKSA